MKRLFVAVLLLAMFAVRPAYAQNAIRESEIQRTVPFSAMLREFPELTLEQYNDAVRAVANDELSTAESGTFTDSSDPQSGNFYSWSRQSNGTTNVLGSNPLTGSICQTAIKPDGSMKGHDKEFNYWTYDSDTQTYINFGTGKICVGEGFARVCS